MAVEQHAGFASEDSNATDGPLVLPAHPVTAAVSRPEVDAATAVDRSFRRRMANRESARRSRARKQRHLEELRDCAALLERENRDLAARADAASARLALALLANAALRTEAAALSRRLAAACAPGCLVASTDMEQMIASLIAEPPQ